MITRIASLSGARTMLQSIQNANSELFRAQEQVTTGRRINRVSDNPADAVSSLNQRATLRRLEQYTRNAEEATSWFDAGDAALADVSDRLAGVRATLVQANSAANDVTSRAALANQIRAQRESILLAANSERGGRPLFAGNVGGAVAYDANGVYQGDNGAVNLPITGGVTLQVNRTGPDIFGTNNPSDPTQGDLFQLLGALATAVETHATLSATLEELRVGLVHGRLSGTDKAAVMDAFKRGEVQLLVATTVIEVGVDVPNASLMVIEHAERMGLAQLHQLRGRVGRGSAESACVLLYQQPLSETARARLRIIFENTDGFAIAQEDLKLRGPGELLGARQSGTPMLRFADLIADVDLLEAARDRAESLLREHPEAAARHVDRWLGGKEELLRV